MAVCVFWILSFEITGDYWLTCVTECTARLGPNRSLEIWSRSKIVTASVPSFNHSPLWRRYYDYYHTKSAPQRQLAAAHINAVRLKPWGWRAFGLRRALNVSKYSLSHFNSFREDFALCVVLFSTVLPEKIDIVNTRRMSRSKRLEPRHGSPSHKSSTKCLNLFHSTSCRVQVIILTGVQVSKYRVESD